jgi:hypothetical protein
MTFDHTDSATSSQAEGSGPSQLDWLDGPTNASCGPAPAPVSRSRSREKVVAPTTFGICGPTSFGSSVPAGPLSSWESRLRERLAMVGSTECALIWREKDTPAGESISRLAPWTPPISDNASTGSHWPTPTVADVQGGRKTRSGDRSNEPLLNGLMTWSTPRASDGAKGGPNQSFGAGGQPLPAQMHQSATWVTPSARDWKDTPGMATVGPNGRNRIDQLPRQMTASWVTPTTTLSGSWWADHEWLTCHDGKARRTQPGTPLLVDGLPGRVGLWRIAGNAISPVLAAEVIGALMDVHQADRP